MGSATIPLLILVLAETVAGFAIRTRLDRIKKEDYWDQSAIAMIVGVVIFSCFIGKLDYFNGNPYNFLAFATLFVLAFMGNILGRFFASGYVLL